jgi:hypothetical protein
MIESGKRVYDEKTLEDQIVCLVFSRSIQIHWQILISAYMEYIWGFRKIPVKSLIFCFIFFNYLNIGIN